MPLFASVKQFQFFKGKASWKEGREWKWKTTCTYFYWMSMNKFIPSKHYLLQRFIRIIMVLATSILQWRTLAKCLILSPIPRVMLLFSKEWGRHRVVDPLLKNFERLNWKYQYFECMPLWEWWLIESRQICTKNQVGINLRIFRII